MDEQEHKIRRLTLRFVSAVLLISVIGIAALFFYVITRESPKDAYRRGYAKAVTEAEANTKENIRFGFTRGSYETTAKLSDAYNLPRDAYLSWEYGICRGFGEKYLVMLGGAIRDSTWLKQYINGTICEECRLWFEANKETLRRLDSTDTMSARIGW